MKYLIFILSLLSLIVAAVLLAIALASCTPDAHSEIRAEWHHIDGTETMGVGVLETDGRRLYAATSEGVYISDDDGYTWRLTLEVRYCTAITIHQNTVYAGTWYDGVFRSDTHGVTWESINNGIRLIDRGGEELGPPIIEQILVTSSGTVIAVGYHSGTHTSTDRGKTWHDVTLEWKVRRDAWGLPDRIIGDGIWSMTEFDGYLWAAYSRYQVFHSRDNGVTWEHTSEFVHGRVADWAVLNDRLYVAGDEGFGRWNEAELAWDDLSQGLPPPGKWPDRPDLSIQTLVVHRERIFAGLRNNGVWMFDKRSGRWIPTGLDGLTVTSLEPHQSDLYAATKEGIYRASIPTVQPSGKALTTWGTVKTK